MEQNHPPMLGGAAVPALDALVAQTRSPDGRQRHAAVRALAASGYAPALPAMLERANDWVEAIRRDAREAVSNFLRPEFTEAWIASLDAVEALMRGRRADHTLLLERIVSWLLEPLPAAALAARRPALPRELARLALRLRLRLREPVSSARRERAWRAALASTDIVQARVAMEHLRDAAERRESLVPLPALVQLALASRFANIRSAALRVALAHPPLVTPTTLQDMCFDAGAGTRERAIAAVRANPSALLDVTARALAGLHAGKPIRTRMRTLGALCTIDRAAGLMHCETLRHDASPALRLAALRHLLGQAQGDTRDALVLDALVDLSPRVRKVAVAAILRGANPPSLAQMRALTAAHPRALASLCSVAARLSPWDRLDYLLDAIPSNGDALVGHLDAWNIDMGHTYVTPTAAQRERLRHEWTARRDLVPAEVQRRVEFHLRSFGVLDA